MIWPQQSSDCAERTMGRRRQADILSDFSQRNCSHLFACFVLHAARAARSWLDQQINDSTRVGLPRESRLVFFRLVTNPRVFEYPEPTDKAWDQVRAWPSCEAVRIPQPTQRHSDLLNELLALPGIHANLVPDAHLAALALGHGLTLCSTDEDFARFPSLRWVNPLTPLTGYATVDRKN